MLRLAIIGLMSAAAFDAFQAPPSQDSPMPPAATSTSPAHPPKAGDAARPNRLASESSPYLLQHAYNPVDWYPWGEEAFKAARELDRPIFLSIGYSTCYWCHVMERESFENAEIAAVMNELFICIKVDREQRPDVDDIYMTAVQLLTGSGGWPMSVFLEPATLKPIVGGTYFPPEDKFGRPGFPSVLRQVSGLWKNNRAEAMAQAERVAEAIIAQHTLDATPVELGQKQVDEAIAGLMSSYDKIDGGFGGGGARRAPKFPMPANLDLLIGAAWDRKPPHVREAVLHTLDRMALGGMYDQIGGGFHRYSVDEKWLVPHFEKMLYDNAQLATTYARAHELTKDAFYAEVVRETLDYVLREMTSKEGGLFSAQDAEVNTMEGGNYVWSAEEIREALLSVVPAAPQAGTQQTADAGRLSDVDFALKVYGVDQGPNFQDPHHPEAPAKNVLFLAQRPDTLAAAMKMTPADFNTRLAKVNSTLLAARMRRDQPGTDDKVLAGWNGLMIAGFAEGGRVLKEPKYLDAAKRAAEFVLTRMVKMEDDAGGLLRSWRDGKADIDAFLDDYACMIHGLLALHRATNEQRWLDAAVNFTQKVRERFWDQSAGAFFDTREGQGDLFVRIKTVHDGATPSGNSVMLLNLLDLHERTKEAKYLDDAKKAFAALSGAIDRHPAGSVLAVLALHRLNALGATQQATGGAKPQAAGTAPAAAPRPPSGIGAQAEKVTLASNPKEVTIKPGSPATFEITLEIAKGWHINTNAPGDEFVIPLKIELSGAQGVKITPQYPMGEAFNVGGSDKPVRVYGGKVTIPVTIEQTGAFSGRPQIHLTYQACNDRVCLEPKRVLVGLRILAQK
jgi:uncharacterized protein YyaL (SSP411 family)